MENHNSVNEEEIKEIFARFGRAYYFAECLHRGLCNLYTLLRLPAEGPITRPRVEEHLHEAYNSTLGQILAYLQSKLEKDITDRLQEALTYRNFLAHHFWFERIHLMFDITGIEKMLSELDSHMEIFKTLDAEIELMIKPLYQQIGVAPEDLEWALDQTSKGKEMDPLPTIRKLRKLETITAVFEVPKEGNRYILIFQTEDGLLWQLCDAGLGWAPFDKVDPRWNVAKRLKGLLPAKITPRPHCTVPWNYDLIFNTLVLQIRLGKEKGHILLRYTKKNA